MQKWIKSAKWRKTAYCDSAALKLKDRACRIYPDSLKRRSASSMGIPLSWGMFALFGVRSIDGQLFRLEMVWFNGHTFTLAAHGENGRDK